MELRKREPATRGSNVYISRQTGPPVQSNRSAGAPKIARKAKSMLEILLITVGEGFVGSCPILPIISLLGCRQVVPANFLQFPELCQAVAAEGLVHSGAIRRFKESTKKGLHTPYTGWCTPPIQHPPCTDTGSQASRPRTEPFPIQAVAPPF